MAKRLKGGGGPARSRQRPVAGREGQPGLPRPLSRSCRLEALVAEGGREPRVGGSSAFSMGVQRGRLGTGLWDGDETLLGATGNPRPG